MRQWKKIKSNTCGLVKKIKRTISSNAITQKPQNLNSKHNLKIGTYYHGQNVKCSFLAPKMSKR